MPSMVPIPREESFSSRLRDTSVTARVGSWLGLCFGVCFLTGLYSHWYYLGAGGLVPPTGPTWGYRVTQGLHVLTGIAAIPLLLVKLWSVYPKLFVALPPLRDVRAVVLSALERLSIAVLVAASVFQLVVGLANSAQWYPWSFSFRASHYAGAWVAIGALLVHVAVKLPAIREGYAARLDAEPPSGTTGPSRRTVVRAALLASAVAVLANAGGTVPLLRRVSVLAVRSGEGPQGVPVNRSAQAAGVTTTARAEDYRLTVAGPGGEVELTRAELEAMEQRTHDLPIACVEGWSAGATWTGVRLGDLLDLVDAPADAVVRVRSLQTRGSFGSSELPPSFARHPHTLLALRLHGEELSLDHGYPCRLIAPNRPGVMQTKWVTRVEVVA
ncbi:Oxidoreductase molybdopterin binding domain-containing protein [Nocardioides scoriae]|uniref:Oxidoreductase molybdopterin binding domain-containing protein n=2 Tax=Nocardioides scoriae TaxID=642780 RepID=A0A1H1RPX5_9ACTN|nr:Oxidoreductase molybdopterin binding domain-containing protein [Nocardioides scoriae]